MHQLPSEHYLVVESGTVQRYVPHEGGGGYFSSTSELWFPEAQIPTQTSLDHVIEAIIGGNYQAIRCVIHLDLASGRCDDYSNLVAELILDRAEAQRITLPEDIVRWIDDRIDISFEQRCRLRGLNPREEAENNAADAFVKERNAA